MTYDGEERRQHAMNCQEEILEKLNRLVEFIEGNGQPGAKIRLDRLERITSVVVWSGGIMVVGCLGFAGWMVQTAFSKVFG